MAPINPNSKFQCYLILGNLDADTQTEAIAKNLGANLSKPSPDIFIIKPEKQSISIDEVRKLKKHIFQKPVQLPVKIVVFKEANKLTIQAQNALLKLLEEPPEQAVIILEAQNREDLLPTVRSRLTTVEASKKTVNSQQDLYLKNSLLNLLEILPQIDNAQEWLDNQMLLAHEEMVKSLKKSNNPPKAILKTIDMIVVTKKMVAANINPTFALANLFLSTTKP